MVSNGKGGTLERIFLPYFFWLRFRIWPCRQVSELSCLALMTEGDGVPIIVVNYCVQKRWEGQQRVKRWANYLSAPGICHLQEPAGWPSSIKDTASYFHLLLRCHSFSHLPTVLTKFHIVLGFTSEPQWWLVWESFFFFSIQEGATLKIFNTVRVACLNVIVENDQFCRHNIFWKILFS